ncbi:TlpA family protein disulfide reductase [Nitrospira defluvii]|nr:TlpA family protein disulfide reductase [Nitrospira defluvii]
MIRTKLFFNMVKTLFIGSLLFVFLSGMGRRPPLVGGPAPNFNLNTLEGRPMALTDLRGKIVLLTFWATWCEPCVKEFLEIREAYEALKDHGLVVLAVNAGERPELIRTFIRQQHITFPTLLDPKVKVASLYGVAGLPVSFFIDENGIIRERVLGGILTVENIREAYRRLQKKRE